MLHCLNNVEAEKIFSTDFLSALNAIIFEFIHPCDLKSNRTVCIYNVDANTDTLSHNEYTIESEIEAHIDDKNVCKVIEIPRSKTLKIFSASSNMTEFGMCMF